MTFLLLAVSPALAEPIKERWLLNCHVRDTNSVWYDRLVEARFRARDANLYWEEETCTVIVPEDLADQVQWCDVDHVNRRAMDYGIGEAVRPEVCRVAGQVEAVWGVAFSIKAAADRAERAAREAEEASRQAWVIAEEAGVSALAASASASDAQAQAHDAAHAAGEAAVNANSAQEDARVAVEAAQRALASAEASARDAREAKEQARQARIKGPYQHLSVGVGVIAQRDLVAVMGEDGVLATGYEESEVAHRLVIRPAFSGMLSLGWDSGFAWPRARVGVHLQGFALGSTAEQSTDGGIYEHMWSPGYAGFATLYAGHIFYPWELRGGVSLGSSMMAEVAVTTPWVTDVYVAANVTGMRRVVLKDDRGFLSIGPSLTVGLDQFATRYGDVEQDYTGAFVLLNLSVLAGGGPAVDQPTEVQEE